MLARFAFTLFCFFTAVSAHADRRLCNQLLSSTALSTSENSTQPELSVSAQAFVNIIQLYTKKADSQLSERAIKAILDSKTFVNPLTDNVDSFSKQVSAALDQLRKSIDVKSWIQIQKQIQLLVKNAISESSDRAEKEDETSRVFSPEVLQKLELGDAVYSKAAWQVVGVKTFLALGTFKKLHLFELVNQKLESRGVYETLNNVSSSPKWQIVGDKTFISVTSSPGDINLFELKDAHLELRSEQKANGSGLRPGELSPGWIAFKEKVFMTVVDNDELYLYELIDGSLELRESQKQLSGIAVTPTWQVVGERAFVVIGVDNDNLYLYELVGNRLETRGSQKLSVKIGLSIMWQTIGHRTFLAAGDRGGEIYLFELTGDHLELRSRLELKGAPLPSWKVVGDRVFLAASAGPRLHLLELVDEKFESRQLEQKRGGRFNSPSWFEIDNRIFLAVSKRDKKLFIYELVDSELELQKELDLDDEVVSSASWQRKGNDVVIAVSTIKGQINLIRVLKGFEKQGGRK